MSSRTSTAVRIAITAAMCFFVAWSVSWVWRLGRAVPAIDFYQVYVQAQIAGRTHTENVYAPDAQRELGEEFYGRALDSDSERHLWVARFRRVLDTTATPLLYTAFGGLPAHYDRSLTIFRLLLIAAFVAGTAILMRAARAPWWVAFLSSALLVRWYLPFRADLFVGNVGSFQLLGLALFLALSRRFPATASAVLTLTVFFKPNIAAIGVLLLVSRIAARDFARLRSEAIAAFCTALGCLAVSSIHYRSVAVWIDWLGAARDFQARLPSRASNNVAPLLSLYERDGTQVSGTIALALLLVASVLIVWKHLRDDLTVVALGILTLLLAAPTVWLQYLVLAVVPAVALLRDRWTAFVGLVSLFVLAGEPLERLFIIAPGSFIPLAPRLVSIVVPVLFGVILVQVVTGRPTQAAAKEEVG